ncbi:MAG: hypothetical protein Q8K93_09030 [Reyranella sp.]|uniref:hypothetical protein n=1 Tax=Reyranella sp. TaxID=1929291 RepID=UPI002730C5D1|nr:hypothetical protein [Reyranella sp.]MDP1962330.1 hypothetical protein [Reyranella sp.]MDP2374571.1 hypothetical protein [Reyranella sp.]
MRKGLHSMVYRSVVLLLWALVAYSAVECRGLFWDGSAFLVNLLDRERFHDFYAARAHIDWLTQAPVLLLADLGIRDVRLLAMAYSATLFAVPAALYHAALARVKHDPPLLAAGVAIVATVYLPTSFFIVGEYNATFAAVTAAMAVTLTTNGRSVRDAVILCALGALCLRSYEAMVYFGPLLAAAIIWAARRAVNADLGIRILYALAALAFIGAAVVSAATIVDYWDHPHFLKVRSTSVDFWQNMQFALPLAGFAICGVASLRNPAWLRGRGPLIVLGVIAVLLAVSPWWRIVHAPSILYPPSHYVARQAAGILLAALLAGMWLLTGRRHSPPAVLATLREAAVSQRLLTLVTVLTFAAAVPDVALTRLWAGYLDGLRGLVDARTGVIRAETLPLHDWPNKLFFQDWSIPALSAIVSRTPGKAYVVADQDYLSNPPFEPPCGLLPRLSGYGWRSPG